MAENTISLLRYLSAPTSPLPSLTAGYTRPTTVYYSHLGHFFIYSFTTAKILYGLLLGASAIFVKLTFVEPAPALKKTRGVWREQGRGMVAVVAGIVGSVLVPNIVAVIMQRVLGKGMSWFASQYSALALYGPAALLGGSCSYILDQTIYTPLRSGGLASQLPFGRIHERTMFTSLLLMQSSVAFVVQMFNIGSAALFFVSALPLFFSLALNPFTVGESRQISLWTYAFGQIFPLLTGTLVIVPVIEVFVPLVSPHSHHNLIQVPVHR